jgi:hypothetical protein
MFGASRTTRPESGNLGESAAPRQMGKGKCISVSLEKESNQSAPALSYFSVSSEET